jgi:acetoin utilization deacetylase AcuC-like enzyme
VTTSCYFSPLCLEHDPGPDHSERSERLKEIVHNLRAKAFKELKWPEVPAAKREDVELAHTHEYVDFVFSSVPKTGYREIEVNEIVSEHDAGEVTVLGPKSGEAALRAVGAVKCAVDDVMAGKTTNAFCAVRPPGHHALADKAMGFCVFNNVAIGVRYAQKRYKIGHVAIVDFDLHHGNGTQAIFEKDRNVFYCSTHQLPLWPETGPAEETGVGNILNVPMPPDLPRKDWLKRWDKIVLPWLREKSFDILFVSAGFDAHKDDPKGEQSLETEDYYRLTLDILSIAKEKCGNRVVAVLEGGYDIKASAASAAAVVRAMMTVK